MGRFHQIASRVYNRPLLIEPTRAQYIFSYLNTRMGFNALQTHEGTELSAEDCKAKADSFSASRVRGSYSVNGGIAIIPVDGSLVHKSGYVDSSSGIRGYDGISAMLSDAVSNPAVKGILLDVDSGGGEVAGVQSLGNEIKAAAKIKPLWAHANEMAASAAYWAASSASKLFLSQTAMVGSIGILTAHTDASKALEEAGYKVTLIYSGAHKVDGNPYEPLPEGVKTELQTEIDSLRTLFAQTVADNRGKKLEDILNTEAKMYTGKDAVDIGLADEVRSFSSTLALLQDHVKTAATAGNFKGGTMSAEHETPVVTAGTFTQADVDAAKVSATNAERSRCASILALDESKGREATVATLMASEMSVDSIKGVLATIPVVTQTANTDALRGMAQGAGVGAESEQVVHTNRIDAAYAKAKAQQGARK